MKKLFLGICCFFALITFAPMSFAADYFLPDGCYVSYQNPTYCFDIPGGSTLHWTESSNQDLLAQQYGPAMAIVMSRAYEKKQELSQCNSDLAGWKSKYSTLVGDYNGLVDEYNSLDGYYAMNIKQLRKQKKLVKKLKAACGSKCYGIR